MNHIFENENGRSFAIALIDFVWDLTDGHAKHLILEGDWLEDLRNRVNVLVPDNTFSQDLYRSRESVNPEKSKQAMKVVEIATHLSIYEQRTTE